MAILAGCRPGDPESWVDLYERHPRVAMRHLRIHHPRIWDRMHTPRPVQLDGRCAQWSDEAIAVGWTVDQWPTVDRVMWGESRCDPGATSSAGARGLMQMMPFWQRDAECSGDLYDPTTNLRCALHVLAVQGWHAWDVY